MNTRSYFQRILSAAIGSFVLWHAAGCAGVKHHAAHHVPFVAAHKSQPYYHCGTCGAVVTNKGDCACGIVAPPFYGYEGACWRKWPEGWIPCPEGEIIEEHVVIPVEKPHVAPAPAVEPSPSDVPPPSGPVVEPSPSDAPPPPQPTRPPRAAVPSPASVPSVTTEITPAPAPSIVAPEHDSTAASTAPAPVDRSAAQAAPVKKDPAAGIPALGTISKPQVSPGDGAAAVFERPAPPAPAVARSPTPLAGKPAPTASVLVRTSPAERPTPRDLAIEQPRGSKPIIGPATFAKSGPPPRTVQISVAAPPRVQEKEATQAAATPIVNDEPPPAPKAAAAIRLAPAPTIETKQQAIDPGSASPPRAPAPARHVKTARPAAVKAPVSRSGSGALRIQAAAPAATPPSGLIRAATPHRER